MGKWRKVKGKKPKVDASEPKWGWGRYVFQEHVQPLEKLRVQPRQPPGDLLLWNPCASVPRAPTAGLHLNPLHDVWNPLPCCLLGHGPLAVCKAFCDGSIWL